MLANWVKETTATTGTGASVTLGGSVASFIRFQDAVTVGDTVIYSIEDGNNREIGHGILSASTTLTRTRALLKLESGTITRKPSTLLSLSGSATVGISNAAEMSGGSFPAPATTTFSNTTVPRINNAAQILGSNSTFTLTANTLYMTPFKLDVGIQISALVAYITTLAASGNLALGVYTMQPDGTPGSLLASVSGITTGSTGVARGTVTQSGVNLSPGWYWVGMLSDSTPAVQTIAGAIVSPLGTNNGDPRLTPVRVSYSAAYSSGLPNPAPTTGATSTMSNSGAAIQILMEGT